MITVERKRTERSRKLFLLMLVGMGSCLPAEKKGKLLNKILSVLSASTRETDVKGWYQDNSVIGVIFTEIAPEDKHSVVSTMLTRVGNTLRDHVRAEQFSQISISCHLFPDEWDNELRRRPSDPTLYPDVAKSDDRNKGLRVIKRAMDIGGSALALVLLLPLFAFISMAVKLTSPGPVFFRQVRIGQHGRPFVFLKFRSMQVNNDSAVHRDFLRQYIEGQQNDQALNGDRPVYKLTSDRRITPLGKLLRRTSLDELPQLINVLKGEMSLVGPRPPIPYELDHYQTWHRARVLEAKPGMTGLWQVSGRSRVSFDEMVRLDLRYARRWSLSLDMKILLLTPAAVISSDGAY